VGRLTWQLIFCHIRKRVTHTSEWHWWLLSGRQQWCCLTAGRHDSWEAEVSRQRYERWCSRCRPRKTQPDLCPDLLLHPGNKQKKQKTFFELLTQRVTDLSDKLQLTVELAHGKNIPRQNRPRIGPPTIPKIFKATWSSNTNTEC